MVLPPLSRRSFLAGLAATGVVAACAGDDDVSPRASSADAVMPPIDGDPFTLGVASGDPTATAVILWTRLAPDPRAPDGGMPGGPVPVDWQLATDERFTSIVADGRLTTGPDVAHSLHVDATGLEPDTTYWYRFLVGDRTSDTGRTRTMPAPGEAPEAFTLAQVSCQRWDQGEYAAFRDIADTEVDLVVHCGDYIYERPVDSDESVRPGLDGPAITLDDYRAVYGLYKGDAHLRAAHAAAPWVVTWDDHEVSNNYVGETPSGDSESTTVDELLERRAAGYQAWWEHLPVRLDPPDGPDLPIHREIGIGDLARIHMLDTRQYRTFLDCEAVSSIGARCAASTDPATTVLGRDQERWLEGGLAAPGPIWDVVAQQIVLHQWRFGDGDEVVWNLDQWDGYPTARARLLEALRGAAGQPVVLTGDVHSSWVADLRADFDDPASTRVGTEFVVPGISSTPSSLLGAASTQVRAFSPHIRHDEQEHAGWLRHDIGPDQWEATYRYVEDAGSAESAVNDGATFVLTPDGALSEA
jgi:alkaline phosphatase D